jgi:hypothetical protein
MSSLFQEVQHIQAMIKRRTLGVMFVVHAGLIVAAFALARLSVQTGWDQTAIMLLLGILGIYLGFLLGAFFIIGPVLPWIRRAKRMEHWTDRLVRDLPVFMEHLPKIIAAVEHLIVFWNSTRQTQTYAQTQTQAHAGPPAKAKKKAPAAPHADSDDASES